MAQTTALPYLIQPEADDDEIVALIESWSYQGTPVPFSDVIGHTRQVDEMRRLAAVLRIAQSDPDRLARMGVRTGGRGAILLGPPGVGKTMTARAAATDSGRRCIVLPTSLMTAELIDRTYRQLARSEPSVVIIDEADRLIGKDWVGGVDTEGRSALLAALDGIQRPGAGV